MKNAVGIIMNMMLMYMCRMCMSFRMSFSGLLSYRTANTVGA